MYAIGEIGANHHVFSVKGDTTINNVVYKKLQWRKIHSNATSAQEFQPPFYYDASATLMGALRDDTTTMQVFYIPFSPLYSLNDTCSLFDEWLIYDYSIHVGDTIWGCLNYYPNYPFRAVNIATEQLWGEDRKVIDCEGSARLVEGVGTDMGPLWQIYAFVHPAKPSFLYDYCVGEEGYCGLELVNGTRQAIANFHFELSPNPVADVLAIELPEGQQADLQLAILDFSGKTVLQQNWNAGSKSMKLNVGHLASGVYLLTIGNENGIAARRFAKQ